jgi:3-oxoacyl-[acyl-carrier protein] reductase
MTPILDGKVAIVTGGSRGIGRAIALRLAADGAKVVIGYQSNHRAAKDVVNDIAAAGGVATSIDGDIADVAHIRSIYDFTAAEFGAVDIVVNNAAITAAGPIATVTEELFDRLIAVNLKSVVFSCQLAAERLRDHGRIVNISTVLPAAHVCILGAYGAAKGGIPVLTRALARELGPRGITVNAVAPGPTDTDMLVPEAREQLNANLDQLPLRRIGRTDDIADIVAFLASDQSRWITGHALPAAGGIE